LKAIFTLACVLATLAAATVGTASAATHPTKRERVQARAASFGFVKALICVGSVGVFIAGNAVLVLKVKKVGKMFGTLTGTGGVIEACTP
jgi:hypothetical protein